MVIMCRVYRSEVLKLGVMMVLMVKSSGGNGMAFGPSSLSGLVKGRYSKGPVLLNSDYHPNDE